MIELGGNIQLVGFKEIDPSDLITVKKMAEKYAERFAEMFESFEKLVLLKKDVHKGPHSQKYEIHGKLLAQGTSHLVESVNNNLFVALDDVLEKLQTMAEKMAEKE